VRTKSKKYDYGPGRREEDENERNLAFDLSPMSANMDYASSDGGSRDSADYHIRTPRVSQARAQVCY
jgi:hypothetical protein